MKIKLSDKMKACGHCYHVRPIKPQMFKALKEAGLIQQGQIVQRCCKCKNNRSIDAKARLMERSHGNPYFMNVKRRS